MELFIKLNKKRSSKQKWTEMQYRVQEDADVAQKEVN